MSIIKLNDISKSYGSQEVLNKINLDIKVKDRIGIVGPNGSGKSTILKIIMGEEIADNGKVEIPHGINIGYLKQATEYSLNDFIEMSTDKSNISDFLKINSELQITHDIDFSKDRLSVTSGGEKTKLALSSILASNPSVLLLDEPTNHLDIDGISWLIGCINNFRGTVIIVSHDRYFLNNTVNKIIEINNGLLNEYIGNYDNYQTEKEKELRKQKEKYEEQQKRDKKIKKEINKLKQWSVKGEKEAGRQGGSRSDSKIKGVKTNAQKKAAKIGRSAIAKQNRLEKMRTNYIEKPDERKTVKFDFNGHVSGASCLIRMEDVSKQFGENLIFSNVNLTVNNREKIGLIGPNGSGKTTFIKIIMNKLSADTGSVWITPSLKIAYMSQDVFDLEENKSIFELSKIYTNDIKQEFFRNLANMGLTRDLFNNKIKTLSLGQRMRIKLAEIIVGNYNLLVLDEPTNHLDLENKIELENALINFPGAIIIASHDRYLLSKVTNKVFDFKNNTIIRSEYGYDEYLKKISNKIVSTNSNSQQTQTIRQQLRILEIEMSDPNKSNEEVETILEEYYKLLDKESKIRRMKK